MRAPAASIQRTVAFNLRFPGQYFDSETGLHYNYFRDYDPAIGRYLEGDPIGLRAGLNVYLYVDGSPLVSADAYGLASSAPGFDPSRNNSEAWRLSNNCYSYALNRSGAMGSRIFGGGGTQPGGPSGKPFKSVTCSDIRAAAKSDGGVDPGPGADCGGNCPDGYRKVKLVITDKAFGNDYHWFRQDSGSGWSSKMGRGSAQQHGLSCPGSFGDYKIDCGVLCVPN